MDAGMVKLLVALALILMSGLSVVSSAAPPKAERSPREKRRRERPAPLQVSGAAPPADISAAALPIAVPSTGSTRPRIFTGEPFATAEADPGTGRRAMKLVVGLTAMAVIGALAILGIVRGLVTVFEGLGR
jgi:hypothetical protein